MHEPVVFGIEDALSTKYGNTFTAEYIPGSTNIAARPLKTEANLAPKSAGPVLLHILKPEFIFENMTMRSLLSESNSTFVALQKNRGGKTAYINISRTYRSIIRACLEKLQQDVLKCTEQTKVEKCKQNISTVYFVECVWHLCEVLFVESASKSLVSLLLDWTRFHFPSAERSATDLLLSGREANESEEYWPTIKALVIQGNLDIARALLKLHTYAESAAFKTADQIFANMATQNVNCGYFKHISRSKWDYWKSDTEQQLTANILIAEPNLEELVKLALGYTEVWDSEISKSESWYELFAGYLFYVNPACKLFELGAIANDWLFRWAQTKGLNCNNLSLNLLDQALFHLMENDINKVIHLIQTLGDNQWFVTHLVDMLYNCGQLNIGGERQTSNYGLQLRNSFLVEFASNLILKSSCWQIGVSYLENCSTEGQSALEKLLPRLSIRSEKMAQKVIAVARKNELFNKEQEICKVQSKKFLNNGRYGSALDWAIRSKDTLYITSVADILLKHYIETGDLLCPDVLINIGAKMFSSSRLVFLAKYFDFYQYYRKRDFLSASELLVNLLESKITPQYFWPSLLIDSIPLLESKDPKIMSKETCTILRSLESELVPLIEKVKEQQKNNTDELTHILKDYRIENIEEIVNLLRLACARNLSRAIVIENTIKSLSL